MATAEKTIAEPMPRSPHVQLAISSFLGGLYVLFSLFMVLAGLPYLWTQELGVLEGNPFLSGTLLILVEAVAIAGFLFLGRRLEGPQTQHGLRAGVFFLCLFFLVTLWITNKVAWWVPEESAGLSMILSAGVGGGLLFFTLLLFRKPGFAKFLQNREDKGWFHATAYKPTQGLRVRRCTVVAFLILGGYGIFTLSRTLGNDKQGPNNQVISNDWKMLIPFLGEPGVFYGFEFEDLKQGEGAGTRITQVLERSPADRAGLKEGFVATKVDEENLTKKDQLEKVLTGKRVNDVLKLTGKHQGDEMEVHSVLLASGHPAVPILYKVHLTLPLLLVLALVWLCWRIVNLPTFADFLIATEAEMNKVSWTSTKRLKQDTVVVLVTVILLAMFLFVIDIIWIKVLSWDWIRVLYVDVKAAMEQRREEAKW